ncbi:coiled-coil domain-containing protein 73 isoform X2 [Pagrus major]|uniref:coiled-coil domain-containing protein 73 isoform X2 n=1 Tax=Pagrus major TaxID=143350 RepID=UPI003CC8CB27
MSKAAEAQWDLGLPSNNIMDLSADSGTLPTHTAVGGLALEQELSCCQTEGRGTILMQLLEFKMHLLEVVEELHIRRHAETRFEDQISKLVLEKQELEWEKESRQHQSETMANQHTESLMNVRKQFQAKIRHIEEEKGKYQVSAELKDKEINNLKGELKSLQLLKYNLEKKSSELEQKLVLQNKSKDSHLNQLGEIEKRFSALSRQCAMVKQAHEKLEQNVDEAMKRNKKLNSANEKQEATIESLKKELEEVSSKLIKVKMSSVTLDKNHSLTGREQRIQQLHQKLNMETEMNKQLMEENVAVRAEKQEVMTSLQHTQQLLLTQTQTVRRVELELQMQREQYQALKQEHEVMREKSKATEDKVVQLMESYTASKTSWDKEKEVFLDRIKSEQQELQALKEAYNELHQKHTELSSQAKVQTQHIYELERRDSSQSLSVSTQLFPTLVEETRGEETSNEHISSSEPPGFGSLQHLASSQTKKPDCLEDTEALTQPVASGSPGEQESPTPHQQSQFKQPLNTSNLHTCPPNNNNLFELCSLSGTTGSDSNVSNKYIKNSNTSQSDPDVVSDLINTASSASDNGLLISRGSNVSTTSGASISGHMSADGFGDLLSKEKSDGGEKELGWKDEVEQGKSNREEEKRNEVQQWNKEKVQGEHVKLGRSTTETRGMLMAKTTDRKEDIKRSTEDSGDTKQPETETKDRTEGEGTDGVEEREKTGPHTPEMQIRAQTTTDTTTEKSDTQQVIDFMDTESPLAASEPSDFSKSLSHDVSKMVADYRLVNKVYEMRREVHAFCSDEHQSVNDGPNIQEVQGCCHDEPQTFAQDLLHQVNEKTMQETPSDKSIANIPTEVFKPLNQSSVGSSQTNTAGLPTQSDNIVSIQGLETNATQTQPSNPSIITRNMEQTDEMCDAHVREDCVLVTTMIEPRALPQSQERSERECGQLRSLVTDDEDGDSSASMKREGQSTVDTHENDTCETVPEHVKKSDLKDACVDATIDSETIESEVETGSCQEHMKHENVENTGDEKKTKRDVCPSHESDTTPETSSAICYVHSTAKEMLLEDTNESSLPSNKTYKSSLDWSCSQRKTGSVASEQNQSGPVGLLSHPSITMPRFLKSKHNKVPLVIASASDLLNASSVCGTAASWRRHKQGELKAMGETATADMESRASLSISSFPVSTSSVTVTRLPWQNTPECSRAQAPGPSSGLDLELSCSQEREDQQSSFRAQISKIEQFLNTERLRLPKRRRTDN